MSFHGEGQDGGPSTLNSGNAPLDSFGGADGGATPSVTGNDQDKDGETPVAKQPRKRPKIDESSLVKPERGLQQLVAKMPRKFKGRGHEAADAAELMRGYKSWAATLAPFMAFEDLTSRCDKLKSKVIVSSLLEKMRAEEADRWLGETFGARHTGNKHARRSDDDNDYDNPENFDTDLLPEPTDSNVQPTSGPPAPAPAPAPPVLNSELKARIEAKKAEALAKKAAREAERQIAEQAAAMAADDDDLENELLEDSALGFGASANREVREPSREAPPEHESADENSAESETVAETAAETMAAPAQPIDAGTDEELARTEKGNAETAGETSADAVLEETIANTAPETEVQLADTAPETEATVAQTEEAMEMETAQ